MTNIEDDNTNNTNETTDYLACPHPQEEHNTQSNFDASEDRQSKRKKTDENADIMSLLKSMAENQRINQEKLEKKIEQMAKQLEPLHEKQEKQKEILRIREEVAKAFLTSILFETEKLKDSDDMSVMNGVVNLESSSSLGKIQTTDVVIRRNTRAFWQSCLDVVDAEEDKRKRVCVIGTPGIGKTTTTAYLIKMLMEKKNTTVVYCLHQYDNNNNNFCYKFVSANDEPQSQPSVTVFREESYRDHVNPETYYIVDPCRSELSCNPASDFQAKVIIVSSPNSKHWGGGGFSKSIGTNTSGVFRYMPAWSLDEVKVAHEKLGKNSEPITEEKLIQRFNVVDGVVRHLFLSYDDAVEQQKLAVKRLSLDQAKKIVFGSMDCVDTLDGTMPKSSLVLYDVDDAIGFDKATTRTVSATVNCMIIQHFKKNFYDMMLNELADKPKIMEEYLAADLLDGMKCDTRPGVGKTHKKRNSSESTQFPRLDCYRRTKDCLLTSAREARMVLFSSSNLTHPLYDLCYCDVKGMFHLFQVTIGKKHSCELEAFNTELQGLEISLKKITLYYAVHPCRYDDFVTNPTDPMTTKRIIVKHLKIHDPHEFMISK